VIRFHGAALTSQQIGELSEVAADCEALEEFGSSEYESIDDFKAICQFCSRFLSLKRVFLDYESATDRVIDYEERRREPGRLTALVEMVKTSKTIEQIHVHKFRDRFCNATEEAGDIVHHHCRNNMMRSRIKRINQKGLLADKVRSSAWPLILEEFSDMPAGCSLLSTASEEWRYDWSHVPWMQAEARL
jgi:hypothetical protein